MLKTEEICTNSCKRCCFLLAHEVHVEARKLCPTHIHVWAETSKKPPIIGIKKTKIETGKHPESKCRELKKRKVSYQQNHYSRILFAICGAGFSKLQMSAVQLSTRSSISCSEASLLFRQVLMCPSAPAVTDISGFAPAEA